MFKPTAARNARAYIAGVPPARQQDIRRLDAFIRKNAPTLKPHFAGNMLGYGSFPYRNYRKEDINWPVVALANQKNYISLYVCSVADGRYAAEKYRNELGKVSVGRSCIRFKRLEDVNLTVLKRVLREAVRHPGLVGAEKHRA